MNDNPIMVFLYVGAAAYVLHMYRGDYLASKSGQIRSGGMPGAENASLWAFLIATLGALLLLGVETSGEIALGLVEEQSQMIWYSLCVIIAAGVIEEVIFRGYLVITDKGRTLFIISCVGFSLFFALIHTHLWATEDGFEWTFTGKAFFSTSILFANSLWFYAVRFGPWNPKHSIFPCMLAHAASNVGVFLVKLTQGYVLF